MIGSEHKHNLLVILGPTATGKTEFAAQLAHKIGAEIISADSRQVYRRMDIGTGKDLEDYTIGEKRVKHHLIDICEPGVKYNVYEYQKDFIKIFSEIENRNQTAILCGGTGMYIEAVTKGYKLVAVPVNPGLREQLERKSLVELEEILAGYKRLHNKSDSDTKKRAIRAIEIEEYYKENTQVNTYMPNIRPLYIGISVDRELRRKRITSRLHKRLESGMVAEVESLLNEGIPAADLIYYGLEYKFITLYLTNQLSYDEMVSKLNTAIHQFAKRQMTWFRKMEREGIKIHWIDALLKPEEKLKLVDQVIKP